MLVYNEMRPPVASVNGTSPLRGRRGTSAFVPVNKPNKDGFKITREDIVKHVTDEGKVIQGNRWNTRHQVTHSNFNN